MSSRTLLKRLCADIRGTQTLELAMICGMIIIGLVAAVRGVADENTGIWAVVSSRAGEAFQGTND